MSRLFLAAAMAVLLAGASGAADPAFDKALRDSLAAVHNNGADLYNQGKDYPGAFRLYEGALRTSRPLLAHRPASQAAIDDGLAAAARESDASKKAFLLHETIEKVRADLKEPLKGPVTPEPKKTVTPEPKKAVTPEPEPKKTVTPEPKKTTTPEPEPKTTTTPEPKKATTPEPKKTTTPEPEPKKTDEPAKGAAGGPTVKGAVTYKGQPVANAAVSFAALDRQGVPAVTARTRADGTYATPLLAGRYTVTVAAAADAKAALPARYATADTSGLTAVVPAGSSTFDFDLQ